ncbi:MAG TPA: hypothetical protein VFP19_09145 [Candidatus Limnocylindrales bacterium]|nr:hypothetical protein [Candidatus Limnocylindrales bacterium]
MTPRERPFGVSVLAVLAAIGTVLGLLVVLASSGLEPAATLIALALTVFQGVTAYGLWTLRRWAWPLALVVWVLGTLDAVRLLTEGTFNTNLVVGPIVVLYLLQPQIRRAFDE